MEGSKELGLDVCLYFYNTNGTWSQDSKFNKGEYALNDLPDLNSFDGVVFDCTNTTNLDEIQYMVRKLQSVNVPVVSIGLIKKAAGINTASGKPNKEKVATLTAAQVEEIAKTKMPDLNAASLEAACSMVRGTCRSMGITVEG